MKKVKLLPSILMLVMCIAVLGVGIYAVSPAKNNVTGTITVIASNPEISITAYYESAIEGNEIGQSQTTRTGVEIDITDTRMTFDTSNANTAGDVDSKYVVIKLQNNSSVEMGVYFAMSETATATATTPAINLSGETLAGTPVPEIMEVSFSPYAKLPANGSVTMQLSFKLLKLYDENYTVDLSDYTIYLNTETPVNTGYLQTFSITEGLTNNEEKNEVDLGSSNVLTSTFNLTASQALTGLYAGMKECSIKVTDKTSEVLTFAFDVPENTCVALFSEKAYQVCSLACNGDIGAMLVKAAEYKGAQTIPGVDGELGFYTTNLDMGQYLIGNVVTYDKIEIPLEYVFVGNDTLDMHIVVGALGVDTATITMTTYFSGNYEEEIYVKAEGIYADLFEGVDGYIYYSYKNNITTPKNGEIIIPNEYNGEPVTAIGYYALSNNTGLKSIIMSNNITGIYYSALSGCISLENINFSENITFLESEVFKDCKSLKSLDLTHVTNLKEIRHSVFEGCISLEYVDLSNLQFLGLGEWVFANCTALKSVNLHGCNNIVGIANFTFYECTALETIILPENLSGMDAEVFKNCSSLKEIILPRTCLAFTTPTTVFEGCTLLSVKYAGTSTEFNTSTSKDNVLSTHSVYCMGDGVTIPKI